MDLTGKSSAANGRSSRSKSTGPSASAKSIGKAPASDPVVEEQLMLVSDVDLGPRVGALLLRLIHCWEARNPVSKKLIGQEMLLIDREGGVIQGFIPPSRVGMYELIPGCVYRLNNFFGSRNKAEYHVTDHVATITFAWNTKFTVLENPTVIIPDDRFRFHGYEDFEANCDSRGGLYDYVGHMRLVNGVTLTEDTVLDEAEIARKRHVCVHVQTHGGPVMKLYIWDNAATVFCEKFKSYGATPKVLMVTTVNPKRIGGTLAITSMSSSRVFMDEDVEPTKEYFEWLKSNSDVASKVVAEVVTKTEVVSLAELFSYIKQDGSKVALFECTATIDDVIQGYPWYYISCGGCNTKAVKGPTTLICNNQKCEKSEIIGVPQYLTRISVYDKSEQAVFVLLGDAGYQLFGKHATELVSKYFEANEVSGADHCVPVPQALLDAIGQTRTFVCKVSDHNLQDKTRTITVTKVLPPYVPPTVSSAVPESGPSNVSGGTVSDKARKASNVLESDGAKRNKSG